MAELATLARPYAIASFGIAKDENRLDHWSRVLKLLCGAVETEQLRPFIASPVHATATKALTLLDLLRDEMSESTRRFVHVLAENQRLELLPAIRDEFEIRLAEENRTLDVEITSAVELSQGEQSKFEEALQRRFAREIRLSTKIDPSIVGGALVRAGDTVLDATVRGKIAKLRTTLQHT